MKAAIHHKDRLICRLPENSAVDTYHAEAGRFLDGEHFPELDVVPVVCGEAVDVEGLGVEGGEGDVLARLQPVADDLVGGADEAAVEQVPRLRGRVARDVLDQPVTLALA